MNYPGKASCGCCNHQSQCNMEWCVSEHALAVKLGVNSLESVDVVCHACENVSRCLSIFLINFILSGAEQLTEILRRGYINV